MKCLAVNCESWAVPCDPTLWSGQYKPLPRPDLKEAWWRSSRALVAGLLVANSNLSLGAVLSTSQGLKTELDTESVKYSIPISETSLVVWNRNIVHHLFTFTCSLNHLVPGQHRVCVLCPEYSSWTLQPAASFCTIQKRSSWLLPIQRRCGERERLRRCRILHYVIQPWWQHQLWSQDCGSPERQQSNHLTKWKPDRRSILW